MEHFTNSLHCPIQFWNGKLITPSMVLTETLVAVAQSNMLYCCGKPFKDIGALGTHQGREHLSRNK